MKTFLSTLILSVLTTASASAAVNLAPYQKSIQEVTSLEASGNKKAALLVAVKTSHDLASALGIQQTVASITSSLNEIRQEVITERHSVGGGFNLLGLLTGKANASWDVSKIITMNPEEVAGFSTKVARDYERLQVKIFNYVQSNELGLVYTKAFAAKALQLAAQLPVEERKGILDLVARTVQQAQKMTFNGVQIIDRCVITHYAQRSKETSASLGGIFLSFNFKKQSDQLAHQVKACGQSNQNAHLSEDELVSAKLFEMDLLIENLNKALNLKELQENTAPAYPTWGLPAYQ